MTRYLCAFLIIFFSAPVFARPVSYPGGWTFITENDDDENSALMHYTITTRTAVGYRTAYDRDSGELFNGIQMNNLIKRWNNPGSQANIYVESALGMAERPEAFVGLKTDWENRRVMIQYDNKMTTSPNPDKREFIQSAGAGVAPHLARSGEIQTWLMFHVLHQPEDTKNWQAVPMLRVYKNVLLFEGGYNLTTKTPVANAIIRF